MHRVAIFGVGLIGGSFALALRRAGFRGEIAGVSSERTIAEAVQLGVIERGVNAAVAAEEFDFIYLAQPVLSIIATLKYYGSRFHREAVVTDAGSTKRQIVQIARQSIEHATFIGGHPMAGKERRGVREAAADLFDGRKYVLTPANVQETSTPGFQALVEWVRRIGAIPVVLNPDDHDRLVAYTSHLPQLMSTALAAVLSEVHEANQVAGPAAVELTRLAASPVEVWRDIFETNQGNIQDALSALTAQLNVLGRAIGKDELEKEFARAAEGARKIRLAPDN